MPQFATSLAEHAAELAQPTFYRRSWLSVDEAIRAACSADQRTSGNWGYWIRILHDQVTSLIDAEKKRRHLVAMKRRQSTRVNV